MWENAASFRALLVFAQHRLWAPDSVVNSTTIQYLSSSQALADYADIIRSLQQEFAPSGGRIPVVCGTRVLVTDEMSVWFHCIPFRARLRLADPMAEFSRPFFVPSTLAVVSYTDHLEFCASEPYEPCS